MQERNSGETVNMQERERRYHRCEREREEILSMQVRERGEIVDVRE